MNLTKQIIRQKNYTNHARKMLILIIKKKKKSNPIKPNANKQDKNIENSWKY